MAGGVQDGQAVSAGITNPSFIFANGDDNALGKIGFADTDPVSGTAVVNIQREQNALWSFIGGVINQVKTYLPAWTSPVFGTTTSSLVQKLQAIDDAFSATGTKSTRGAALTLGSSVASKAVVFTSAWPDALYVPEFSFSNTVDANPIFLQGIVTAKSTTGFTVTFNAPTDSANYVLNYMVRKAE